MINLSSKQHDNFTLIEIKIDGGICEPSDLKNLGYPLVNYQKGVIISGRAPVWVFATLVHEFHPALWVATFDPRLGGGIVVQTHSKDYSVGDIIPLRH